MEQNRSLFDSSRRIAVTPGETAKKTFFCVREAGYALPGDNAMSDENGGAYLIAAVVSGHGELSVNDEIFNLSAGECFFIGRGIPYSYKSTDNSCELLWVFFEGAVSQQYYEYFSSQSKSIFIPEFFDRAVSLLTRIISVNDGSNANAEIISSKLIVDLLTLALTVDNSQQYGSALRRKLAAVYNYIEDNFNKDLTLEKLSSEFYISRFYLSREYKRLFGMSIIQHIIAARINYGKRLLRFTDRSVEEIAHLCGFNDQSYFARQFKRSEGLTCISYRKSFRE